MALCWRHADYGCPYQASQAPYAVVDRANGETRDYSHLISEHNLLFYHQIGPPLTPGVGWGLFDGSEGELSCFAW